VYLTLRDPLCFLSPPSLFVAGTEHACSWVTKAAIIPRREPGDPDPYRHSARSGLTHFAIPTRAQDHECGSRSHSRLIPAHDRENAAPPDPSAHVLGPRTLEHNVLTVGRHVKRSDECPGDLVQRFGAQYRVFVLPSERFARWRWRKHPKFSTESTRQAIDFSYGVNSSIFPSPHVHPAVTLPEQR
jgi:hypothetical protein